MAERPRGMGRGLAAILAASQREETEEELRELPIELIAPNPRQPRGRFDDEGLSALAESIRDGLRFNANFDDIIKYAPSVTVTSPEIGRWSVGVPPVGL